MKNLLFTAVILFATMTGAFAQTELGNWRFGGGTTFSYSSSDNNYDYQGSDQGEEKYKILNFSADANYFAAENLAIGVEFLVSSTKYEYSQYGYSGESTSNSYAILPEATYYFKNGNVAPFIGVQVGYMATGGDDDYSKFDGLALGGNAGLAFFLSENVSLDLMVSYVHSSMSNGEESDYKVKNDAISAGLGFSLYF